MQLLSASARQVAYDRVRVSHPSYTVYRGTESVVIRVLCLPYAILGPELHARSSIYTLTRPLFNEPHRTSARKPQSI